MYFTNGEQYFAGYNIKFDTQEQFLADFLKQYNVSYTYNVDDNMHSCRIWLEHDKRYKDVIFDMNNQSSNGMPWHYVSNIKVNNMRVFNIMLY